MAQAVANIRKINVSDITFSEPIKNKKTNAVSVQVLYKGQKVQFRLPKIDFPGGALVRSSDNGTTYTLIGSLKGCDPYGRDVATDSSDAAVVYNFLRSLKDQVLKYAFENSGKLFGKKRSMESLVETFKDIISISVDKTDEGYVPNGKYPPSVRIKIPVWDGNVNMEVIDTDNNHMHPTVDNLAILFPKSCSAATVITPSIYVAGLSFGVTLKVTDAQVFTQRRMTAADKFRNDEDDEEAVESKPDTGAFGEIKNYSEEEQQEETHEESAPASVPEPPQGEAPKTGRRRVKA